MISSSQNQQDLSDWNRGGVGGGWPSGLFSSCIMLFPALSVTQTLGLPFLNDADCGLQIGWTSPQQLQAGNVLAQERGLLPLGFTIVKRILI